MKKESIKTIAIICLSIVIVILLVCMFLVSNNKYYKYYDDSLIKMNNKSNFEVTSNIIYDQTLAVLLTSKENKPNIGEVKVTFYNKKGEKVSSDNFSRTVYNGSATLFTFNVPLLKTDEFAGTISVEVNDKSMENNKDTVSIANIQQSISKNINNDKSLSIKANLVNKNTSDLSVLGGDIVAFKDGKIVASNSFYQENVKANDSFAVNVNFPSYSSDKAFEYDDIKLYITAIADTAE